MNEGFVVVVLVLGFVLFFFFFEASNFEGLLSGKGRMEPSLSSSGKETPCDTGLCLKPDRVSITAAFQMLCQARFLLFLTERKAHWIS